VIYVNRENSTVNPIVVQSSSNSGVVGTATVTPAISGTAKIVSNPTPIGTATISEPNYPQVFVDGYRHGDSAVRYRLTIPSTAEVGQVIRVQLGGREETFTVPNHVAPGQQVTIVASSVVTATAVIN
jgi:hypothetical protein